MAARCRYDIFIIPCVDQSRGDRHTLRHGRASPVHPQKGELEIPCRKRRGNDLIEQIPRNEHIYVLFVYARIFDGLRYGKGKREPHT